MNSQEVYRSAFPDRETPKISYGLPFPETCAKHVGSTFEASKVYIISSGSLARNTDTLTRLQSALGNKVVGTRIGMKSHTLWSEILEITKDARASKADLLVTLGAGSLTDGAKIIALALANDINTIDDLASLPSDSPKQRENIKTPTAPIISIPTSLSGGEYSNFAGGTEDATHRKHSFSTPTKGPALVILDAALSATTPDSIWLSTGIRAVDHCVETLCSLQSNPESDKDAENGLGKLIPGLLKSKHNPRDLDARHLCQLGVIEAMSAASKGVPLGASHGIGHQLGPLGVGHGETSCILLPAVCKYNAAHNANVDRQKAVIGILKNDREAAVVLKKRGIDTTTADLGDMLDAIIRELGMPRSLKDVQVGRDQLDSLAKNSLHDRWCVTNPVPLKKKQQVLDILEEVVG